MKSHIVMLLGSAFLIVILAACGGGGGGSSDDGGSSVIEDTNSSDDGGSSVIDDTNAPYVLSTNPVFNSTGEDINRAITATFNEDIDPATITSNSFLVDKTTGGMVTGTVAYDSASRTAIFRSDVNFETSTAYIATITNGVEDLAGNPVSKDYTWQFETAAPPEINAIDTTPPEVLSRFPSANAISVAPNAVVSVTFNEPIDPFSFKTESLTLNGASLVAGTVSYVGTTVLFKPADDLAPGTVYTVTFADTIMDLAGNPLREPVIWSFTTGNQLDIENPQVLSTFPEDGAVSVPIDSLIKVNFNEAIKPFDFGTIDGRPVTVSFNSSYKSVSMQPTAGLLPGRTYAARIKVQDQAGNPMDEPFVFLFTTVP